MSIVFTSVSRVFPNISLGWSSFFLLGCEDLSFEVSTGDPLSGDETDYALSFAFERATLAYDDYDMLYSSPSVGAVFEGNSTSDDDDCRFKF